MSDEKNLTIRLDPALLERVQRAAKRSRRSINSELNIMMEGAYADEPDTEVPLAGRKTSSVRYGEWTIWYEHKDPRHVKVCAPVPSPDQDGWWVNPYGGTPGNGREGSVGFWFTLRYDNPDHRNAWNRCVHAFEESGQLAPPYML